MGDVPQNDIPQYGLFRHQHKVLMDHADSQTDGILGGVDFTLLAKDADRPFIGLGQPVQNIHNGGFAGAIFPDEAVDFRFLYGDVYMVIGQHAGKCLGNILQFDCIGHGLTS